MQQINIKDIKILHEDSIIRWKKNSFDSSYEGFLKLVEQNHSFNFFLWNAEDRARREDMGYEYVYRAKREIDSHNQQRNNYMEKMDTWLYQALDPAPIDSCHVHSETPGMMIDRLSILALKVYHMGLQLSRTDVDESHIQLCQQKVYKLTMQKLQLEACLDALLKEISEKKRTFAIYHQFKMYNDPNLNPFLSSHRTAKS